MSDIAIKSFLTSGKTAVFARRFSTEIDADFFRAFEGNLRNEKDKTHFDTLRDRKFEVRGNQKKGYHAYITPQGEKAFYDRPAVSFYPLSMSTRKKSAFKWETHKNIYIDEYIPADGVYSRTKANEMTIIAEWYKTIDRKHYDNYVLICGNKITRFNPIFQYFNITHWKKKGISSFQEGEFDLLVWSNEENIREEKESAFGRLMRGTDYESYNNGGFLSDGDPLIKKEHSKTKMCEVVCGNNVYAAYYAENSIVFAPSTVITDNANKSYIRLCDKPVSSIYGAIFIDAPQAHGIRNALSYFKYHNGIFFDSEITYHNLLNFYNKL